MRRHGLASAAASALAAVLVLLVMLVCGCAMPSKSAASAQKPLNIVFIVADDHAAHAMSCYGSTLNRTPNLDALAAQGMRLDRAFEIGRAHV